MKGIGIKTPLCTENGIIDGQPFLPNLPLPKVPVLSQAEQPRERSLTAVERILPSPILQPNEEPSPVSRKRSQSFSFKSDPGVEKLNLIGRRSNSNESSF